jgi:site-specific recombinase XerD
MYDLRAVFATRLLAAGVPQLSIAYLLGHSSTSILPTYAKAGIEFRRDAIEKLQALRINAAEEQQEREDPETFTIQ